MPLAKCVRCDKLFDKAGAPVCANCQPDEEADFERVREFLAARPESSAELVSESTGVALRCVLRMVEEGFVTSSAKVEKVRCGRCGALAISLTKKLCTNCLDDLNRELARERSLAATMQRREPKPAVQTIGVKRSIENRQQGLA